MQGSMANKVIAVMILVFLAYWFWPEADISYGPGMVAPNAPVQSAVSKSEFYFKGYKIKPVAEFTLKARVLSRADYSSDFGADIMPVDLAFGWGPMSDESVLNQIQITQRKRFYYWYTEKLPIPRRQIVSHSANMHLVPATEYVLQQLKNIKKGHVVSLKGYLVNIEHKSRRTLRSSTTRQDEGAGACEVIWVEDIQYTKNVTPQT
jgi:hypothetical protein